MDPETKTFMQKMLAGFHNIFLRSARNQTS